MIARIALLLILLTLAAPVAAVAQDSPFNPLPTPSQQSPTQTVNTNADPNADDDDGLSRSQQALIGIAGFVLLFGIGWAIIRDARSVAPADKRDPLEEGERTKGSQRPKQKRVSQGRARAKAARHQRRKNR